MAAPSQRAVDVDRLVRTWRTLVELESGSTSAAGIDATGDALGGWLADLGFDVRRIARTAAGASHVLASRAGGGPSVLLLGHLDTVWPTGTLRDFPFALRNDVVTGPGVADMKGGLAVMIEALRIAAVTPDLRILLTADEELGTPTGRLSVERSARRCRAALGFEAGRPNGALVTSRRAVGVFELVVSGRTAHVAHDPERGVNAVDELAHQLLRLRKLRDPARQTYVMAGVVSGGTARQVVPERARALIDVRAPSQSAMDELIRELMRLPMERLVPGARVRVQGRQTRPPMLPGPASASIQALVRAAARDVGQTARFASSGGGSDASFAAAIGVPTIDGFGPPGRDLCSRRERASLSGAVARVQLVTRILERSATSSSL